MTRRPVPPARAGLDPRVHLLLGEMFRHAKVIGTWGGADQVLAAANLPEGAPRGGLREERPRRG